MAHKKWTDEEIQLLKKLYVDDNLPIKIIADKLKVSEHMVSYRVKCHKFDRRRIYAKRAVPMPEPENRLSDKRIRWNLCVMYIDHLYEQDKPDIIGYLSKACKFTRKEVETCIEECKADNTYNRVLNVMRNCNELNEDRRFARERSVKNERKNYYVCAVDYYESWENH